MKTVIYDITVGGFRFYRYETPFGPKTEVTTETDGTVELISNNDNRIQRLWKTVLNTKNAK